MGPKLGLALLITAAAAVAAAAADSDWVLPVSASSRCDGRVGDCVDPEEESMMESDGVRRQLWDYNKYISYQAMNKNNIPCNRAGRSYYNCRGNNAANPYRRGCTAITNCARSW